MKIQWPADGGLALARVLLLADLVTTPIATTVENVIEFAAYGVILIMPEPRRRVVEAMRHPAIIGALPLAAMIVIAAFYGPAAWSDALRSLFAWRRILVLPLAAALFFDVPSKRLVLKVLVVTCVVGTLVSFVTFATGFWITQRLDPGIVFHDYAVQGVTFSLAAIACVAALLRPADFAGDRPTTNWKRLASSKRSAGAAPSFAPRCPKSTAKISSDGSARMAANFFRRLTLPASVSPSSWNSSEAPTGN